MEGEEFTYEAGQWLEHESASQWPYWVVARRLADVDDGARFYQLRWHHPRSREYREEYVPADDAVADFERVEKETVWAAAGREPPEDDGGGDPRDARTPPDDGDRTSDGDPPGGDGNRGDDSDPPDGDGDPPGDDE